MPVLRALMLNPRKRAVVAYQAQCAIGGDLYDIGYATIANSLTFTKKRSGGMLSLDTAVSSAGLVTLVDSVSGQARYRRYSAGKAGLTASFVDSLTPPSPVGGNTSPAYYLGTGDFFYGGATALYAANSQRQAGPVNFGTSTIYDVGDAVAVVAGVTMPTAQMTNKVIQYDSSHSAIYTTVTPSSNGGSVVARTFTSGGLSSLALSGIPWASVPQGALIRLFGVTWISAARAYVRGAMRMAAVATTNEWYDDGDTGLQAILGDAAGTKVPMRAMRHIIRNVVGVVTVTATGAAFEAHYVVESARTLNAVTVNGDPLSYMLATYDAPSGKWLAGGSIQDSNQVVQVMRPLVLTGLVGMLSADPTSTSGNVNTAPLSYSDGSSASARPKVPTNSASTVFWAQTLGALIAQVPAGFGQPIRQAYVSLDLGQTWAGPASVLTKASPTATAAAGSPVAAGTIPVPLVV